MIGIQFSFYFELQISPFFYFPGITFRYSELYFQWSPFGQFGYYSGRGGVCSCTDPVSYTHLAQTNVKANTVPILVISPATRAGTNAASPPTMAINNKLLCAGVRYFS